MLQKLLVNGFKWVEDFSEFNEDFIKNYNEKSDEGYFLEVDVQYPENMHEFYYDLPFFPELKKFDKVQKLVANFWDKKMYYTPKKSKTNIESRNSF